MRSSERRATMGLIDAIEWADVTADVADRAGELARTHHRAHSGIDIADYLIAATVELLGAELFTRNLKHFPMFPGLTAPY